MAVDGSALNSAVADAIDKTAQDLLNKLNEIIQSDVYNGYSPIWYSRTHEFGETWSQDDTTIDSEGVHTAILQKVGEYVFNYNPDLFQHGNPFKSVSLQGLDEIIDDGNIGHAFGFPPDGLGERPYWKDFMDYVDSNIDMIFKSYLDENIQSSIKYLFT
jgi:hypothetical protein